MRITAIIRTTLIAFCAVCVSAAQDKPDSRSTVDRPPIAMERSPETTDAALITRLPHSETTAIVNSEVFRNVIVPAGKSVYLDSTLDYSFAGTVSITVLCSICSTAATSLGSSGVILVARWAVPNADAFVPTENKAASSFPYWDSGGAIFNVYGSQFRLTLQNKGTQSIAIQLLTIFRRGQ